MTWRRRKRDAVPVDVYAAGWRDAHAAHAELLRDMPEGPALARLVHLHGQFLEVSDGERGFRDYTFAALRTADPIAAAKFLVRTDAPESSWRRLEASVRAGRSYWRPDSPPPQTVALVPAEQPSEAKVTVYLDDRDWTGHLDDLP